MSDFKLYKSYSFRDKDPIIDQMRTAVQDVGLSYGQIEGESGVSSSTMYNWFHGDVRRPQFATIAAVARAIGYDIQLVSKRTAKIIRPHFARNGLRKVG
jgi:transcriptional regulator with XRE-family HTH domain